MIRSHPAFEVVVSPEEVPMSISMKPKIMNISGAPMVDLLGISSLVEDACIKIKACCIQTCVESFEDEKTASFDSR